MNQEIREVIFAINRVYQKFFTDEIAARPATPLMDRLAMTFNSTNAEENYAWLTDPFAVRRWTGERESIGGFASTYKLRNELYEGTKHISIVDIEDGVYVNRAEAIGTGLADAFRRKKESVLFELINRAFTAPDGNNGLSTIDGKALFATDHPWWSLETIKANGNETYRIKPDGTFSNRTNAPFSEDALWTAYEQFMLMTNHQGEPAGVMPNLLVVGPKLARSARQLLSASTIAREVEPGVYVTEQNDTAGMFDLLVEPRLGTSQKWMLFDTSSNQKPFILQNRKEAQFQINGTTFSEDAAAGNVPDIVFHKDQIEYGVRGRFGVGYGLPYYAYGSTAGE